MIRDFQHNQLQAIAVVVFCITHIFGLLPQVVVIRFIIMNFVQRMQVHLFQIIVENLEICPSAV